MSRICIAHAIKARITRIWWLWFGVKKIWLEYNGQMFSCIVRVKTYEQQTKVGDELYLIDTDFRIPWLTPIQPYGDCYLFIDFEHNNLRHSEHWCAWVPFSVSAALMHPSPMSREADDACWMITCDEVSLTLLLIEAGRPSIYEKDFYSRRRSVYWIFENCVAGEG